jgi:hypothetical protein
VRAAPADEPAETFHERYLRERREAGLPERIEDEVVLHKLATIVIEHDRSTAARS